MQVGDLVRWVNDEEFCGIVLETWGDYPNNQEVLVWFHIPWRGSYEWCFAYDLEVVKGG